MICVTVEIREGAPTYRAGTHRPTNTFGSGALRQQFTDSLPVSATRMATAGSCRSVPLATDAAVCAAPEVESARGRAEADERAASWSSAATAHSGEQSAPS